MTASTADPSRFKELPPPVRFEELVTSQDVAPLPDPQADRDTERDFMLRYAG